MLEMPEATVIAAQLNQSVVGLSVLSVIAGANPHKLAWLSGDSAYHESLLVGRRIEGAAPVGGMVELRFSDGVCAWFGDGTMLRLLSPGEERGKHQLLIELSDGSALRASVAMYGGMTCMREAEMDNPYVLAGKRKPSLLSDSFDRTVFDALIASGAKLSAKAFLATEQRIPGLGNGVVQDVLFCAGIHPKRKINTLNDSQRDTLFTVLKELPRKIAQQGGRDTETDLFGNKGGYKTLLSRNTASQPCPRCCGAIVKEAYLGGSVYYCPTCQPIG